VIRNTGETRPGRPGPTRQLANWVATTRLDDVPRPVVARAKILLLDGFGCGLLGAHLPWSESAVAGVTAMEGEGESIVWGWEKRLPAPAAALVNATFIQGFELDDYHQFGPLHSEACVLPSVLATAELLGGVSGDRLLEAAIIGMETGPRVGMALGGLSLVSRGFHCGAVYGPLASAAGAGRLRGLDADAMEDAFGIAATQASGLMAAQYEAMVKRMHSGFAARSGLYAAGLADAGYSGIKAVVEREFGGLGSAFSGGETLDVGALVAGLGERWEVERIAIKPPYSCMAGLHTSIDGIKQVLTRRRLSAKEVAKVNIGVSHAIYHHGGWRLERPAEVIGAQMNIAYAVAVTLADGDAFVPQFTPARVDSDDVWDILDRVHLHWDEGLDDLGPDKRWTARLRVEFTDGSIEELEQEHAWGSVQRPMTNDETVDKFWRMASLVMDSTEAKRLHDLVMNIEELDDTSPLLELLGRESKSPF
jgi:aconitate decarboxylase